MQESRTVMDRGKWLLRLIWVRAGIFTVFVAAQRSVDMLVLLGAVYALSLCWVAFIRLNKSYVAQAYAQIAVDLLLITWTVNRTGGLDSYFSSLYFLEIVMSSILLERRGAYLTAIASSLLHGVHIDLAHFQVIPSTTVSFPEFVELQYIVGVTILGFSAVGFLANVLAENWHITDAALEKSTGEVESLQALNTRIVESLGSGLITTDLDGKIVLFNPAAARISGRSSAEAVGRQIQEVLPGLEPDAGPGRLEVSMSGPSGRSVCLQFSITPLAMDPDRMTGYVWSFDDVTELREMERQLRHKERMAAIGVMSAGIAHEIRNPLASITGSFDLLRSELDLGSEQKQLAGIIARETERLNQTINDFLLYARPVVPRKDRIRLDGVIADSVQLIRNSPDLGPEHKIETDLEPVSAEVDERLMRQVFYNLASNAFKAMPDSGTLNIRLESDHGSVNIQFEDSGVGMTEGEIDQLFLPFNSSFRTGTGLGLSIVYQIVNAHHGSIGVRSEPGKGTVFEIELPEEQGTGVGDSSRTFENADI